MSALTHKGYAAGPPEFDPDARLFHGEVLGLRDVVTFQGRSVDELEQAFRGSVDDYLAFCAEEGDEPERPYSGKFVVRTSPRIHRFAALASATAGLSLNQWVERTIERTATGELSAEVVRKETPT